MREKTILEALMLHASDLWSSPPAGRSQGISARLLDSEAGAEQPRQQRSPPRGKGTGRAAPRGPPSPATPCPEAPRSDTIAPTANEAGAAANEAPADAATDPALYKSFDGFEEDPSQEHAAGGGRERSFSGPHQHQWEVLESDPSYHEPFQWGFTVKISGRIQRGMKAA